MLSENALSDDVGSTQRSDDFLAAPSRPHVIDQVTQTVPKSGQKADYIQCRARLASFGGGKIAKNRGKIVAA